VNDGVNNDDETRKNNWVWLGFRVRVQGEGEGEGEGIGLCARRLGVFESFGFCWKRGSEIGSVYLPYEATARTHATVRSVCTHGVAIDRPCVCVVAAYTGEGL
jgi:hypothetical protein